MKLNRYSLLLLLMLPLMNGLVSAQSRSYDGQRWYEIEVSIFTNRDTSVIDKEENHQDKIDLFYPDDILQLIPATASYALDFSINTQEESSPLRPEYSPTETPFRVNDFNIDPYIALGIEHHGFSRSNQRISSSSEHRLLYHATWRQPVFNKVQASAIVVRGGDQYGEHNELEGSITLSYNINRVDIHTMLWLNSFMVSIDENEKSLTPPVQVFPSSPSNDSIIPSNQYYIEDISVMTEVRQMRSYELHYLDHPAFGLLIQIRPYELPLDSEF